MSTSPTCALSILVQLWQPSQLVKCRISLGANLRTIAEVCRGLTFQDLPRVGSSCSCTVVVAKSIGL
jgi:hypothetical protein